MLRSKGNRAHRVAELTDDGYVRGKVRHGGLEHQEIELKGWHKPVPNSAIESWSIDGSID